VAAATIKKVVPVDKCDLDSAGIKVDPKCIQKVPLTGKGCDKKKNPKCEDTATEIKKPGVPISEEAKKKLAEEAAK